ncbi:ORF6N domain-containing protein [Escherichia coli]
MGASVEAPGSLSRLRQPCTAHHQMIGVAGGDEKTLSEATAMTVQISAESLSPLHHNQLPVITTELLASLYGTEVNGIQQNFKRNIARFVVGKHFLSWKVMNYATSKTD